MTAIETSRAVTLTATASTRRYVAHACFPALGSTLCVAGRNANFQGKLEPDAVEMP
jgi:hypothetical protein